MYLFYTKVIFIVFIFCVCCNGNKIYVSNAPHNLTAQHISEKYVDLVWVPPSILTTQRENLGSKSGSINVQKNDLSKSVQERLKLTQPVTNELIPAQNVVESYKQYDTTHLTHYVLFYEEWLSKANFIVFNGAQDSDQIKEFSIFQSESNPEYYNWSLNNITLLHISGMETEDVHFRLGNLTPFSPYKIWVHAFQNFSFNEEYSHLSERLGPMSEPLYVWTEVRPPSAPTILNVTYNQLKGTLSVTWLQPHEYDNSLDQYMINLCVLPERKLCMTVTLLTNKDKTETTYDFVNIAENTSMGQKYEIVIYAATKSVVEENKFIYGEKSLPYVVTCGTNKNVEVNMAVHSRISTLAMSILAVVAPFFY